MSVEFEDYSIQVKGAIKDAAKKWLEEAAGEIESQAKRNMPSGHWYAQQKAAFDHRVDTSALEAHIGNPMEEALWTEFGTGEFAVNGDGRKGYWVYVKGSGKGGSTGGKSYTLEEAKRVMAMMQSDGIDAHITKGQRPHRPLQSAFTSLKSALIRRAENIMKGLG